MKSINWIEFFLQSAENHGSSGPHQNEGQKDFIVLCGQKSISPTEKNANISGSGFISWRWV